MQTLSNVILPALKTFEAFGLFFLNQSLRLALGLLEMNIRWSQLFCVFVFNALARLKFPITEKRILLPNLAGKRSTLIVPR